MEKQIFKIGDKVYNHKYGWGIVTSVGIFNGMPLYVTEFNEVTGWFDDSSLSFTEYTLDGFSQERPINYEEYIEKWGKFWYDNEEEDFIIGKLKEIRLNGFVSEGYGIIDNFQPLTEEQLKALNLKNDE